MKMAFSFWVNSDYWGHILICELSIKDRMTEEVALNCNSLFKM